METQYRLSPGALTSLLMQLPPEGASVMQILPSSRNPVVGKGYRSLFLEETDPGEAFDYFLVIALAVAGARVFLEKMDSNFHQAYERAAQTRLSMPALKALIEGRAALSMRIKHAVRKFWQMELEDFYQWHKNMMALARAA